MLSEKEKGLMLVEHIKLINLLKGCVVSNLDAETNGDKVFCATIYLKHPNGNEFVLRSYGLQQLHIVQTT